jgi:hypothetical protein
MDAKFTQEIFMISQSCITFDVLGCLGAGERMHLCCKLFERINTGFS